MPPNDWIDDITIPDDELLWRRVRPDDIEINSAGIKRPKSALFLSRNNLLSVDIGSITNPTDALAGYTEFSLAEFTAGLVRSFECIVIRNPLPDNHAHALVIGQNRPDGSLTKAQAKNIAKRSEILTL